MVRKLLTTILYAVIFGSIFIIMLNLTNTLTEKRDPNSLGEDMMVDLMDRSKELFDIDIPNPFEVNAPMVGYGLLLLDYDGYPVNDFSFTYDGDTFNQFVTLVNSTDEDTNVGLVLFVEDRLVPFEVDGKNKSIFHTFNLHRHSYLYVPVTFEPRHRKETAPMYWVLLRGIEGKTEEEKVERFAAYSVRATLSADGIAQVAVAEELPSIQPSLKREGIQEFTTNSQVISGFSNSGFDRYKYDGYGFSTYHKEIVIDRTKEDQVVTFEAFGAPGSYTTVIFIDHQPIEVAGANQFQWEVTEDEMIHVPFTIDESIPEGQYVMYSITFPTEMDGPVTRPIESEQYVITVK